MDDDNNRSFDGTIGKETIQRVGVKRKLQNSQDKCQTKKRKISTNVPEEVELSQKYLRSADDPRRC